MESREARTAERLLEVASWTDSPGRSQSEKKDRTHHETLVSEPSSHCRHSHVKRVGIMDASNPPTQIC